MSVRKLTPNEYLLNGCRPTPSLLDSQEYEYDVFPDMVIEEQAKVLLIGDRAVFSIGNISCIVGQAKSRKTFLMSAIAAAFIKGESLGMTTEMEEGKLLFVDTEQGKEDVLRVARRIYRLCGWDFSVKHFGRFRMLSLRELSPLERRFVIDKTIDRMKPHLVIIDGVSDLVPDTNDLEAASEITQHLMRLSTTKNCHISVVLHTNPTDNKGRGHIGSELQRKAETTLEIKKEGDVSTVRPQFTRQIEPEPFTFAIDNSGLPVLASAPIKEEENMQSLFRAVFDGTSSLNYTDLVERVMNIEKKSKRTATRRIEKAVTDRIIQKDGESYRIYEEPKDQDLPFNDDCEDRWF